MYINAVYALSMALPFTSLLVRRCKDAGINAWIIISLFYIFSFTIIIPIVIIIIIGCKKEEKVISSKDKNKEDISYDMEKNHDKYELSYCRVCGLNLEIADVFCRHCGSYIIEIMYCRICGEEITSNCRFCRKCGTKT